MQGAGNDFVVVDARDMDRDWPAMAIQVCNRHLGIGCDSLITVLKSDKADIGMRTYDADGSEAETCGNGIRCIARYSMENGIVSPDSDNFTIETVATVNRIKCERENGRVVKFWANMGRPRLKREEIPVDLNGQNGNTRMVKEMVTCSLEVDKYPLTLNFVSMGNPHAVHFLKETVAKFPMDRLGTMVEFLPIFPERVNFEVAHVLNNGLVEARVWERGVGETQACGSGTAAITVAARLNGFTAEKILIKLPGGILEGIWGGIGDDVVIGGPAESVYQGIWPERENR